MTTFVRVEDKTTGHQYDLPETAIDDTVHTRVDDPENWPDLTGPTAAARPPVYAEKKPAAQPAAATKSTAKKAARKKSTATASTATPHTPQGAAPADQTQES